MSSNERPKYVSTKLLYDDAQKDIDKNILINHLKVLYEENKEKLSYLFKVAYEFNISPEDDKKNVIILQKAVMKYLEENYPHTIPDLDKYMIGFGEWGVYSILVATHGIDCYTFVECTNKFVCPLTFQWVVKNFTTMANKSFTKYDYINFGEIHIFTDGSIQLMGFQNNF
jgi:hypothetical protein